MKKILFMALAAAAMMTSCSTEDVNGGEPNPDPNKGKVAYLALNLSGIKGDPTRANTNPGTDSGEDDVNDITILLFDANNKFIDIKTPAVNEFTKTDYSYQTTTAFLVPAATAKVFVVVNNKNNDGAGVRFAMPTLENDLGKDWSLLNKTLDFTPAPLDNVNGFIDKVTGQLTSGSLDDNFTMANFGVRAANDNGLITVVTGTTPEAAKAAGPNTVYVDRLASKVDFKITEIGAQGAGEIAALPTSAKFFFQGWELNATNRKMRLYSPHAAGYTGTPDPTDPFAGMVAYRVDANYTRDTYGTSISDWSGYENQFVFLRNVGTDGVGTTSTVSSAASTIKYCPENTMAAADQLRGATTKVVVKGNYVPSVNKTGGTFAANESYFTYAGDYYTLTEIKTAYAASVASGHNQGLAQDMDAFMKGSMLVDASADDAVIEAAVAALAEGAAATQLNEKTGIIGRVNNAVRYFHKGVSYYEVLIRHDQRVTASMTLGKYGTVRNNWYQLTLNKVSKPGTPWIPGGPDVPPTDPNPDTPDDVESYLDVTIAINPWITWSQGIEL